MVVEPSGRSLVTGETLGIDPRRSDDEADAKGAILEKHVGQCQREMKRE